MEVLTKDQAALVDQIKAYHAAFEKSFGDQMGYAFLAGVSLNAAKESLPHGKFMEWRESHLPEIKERSAQRYMKFADQIRHGMSDLPTVGKLKLLGNGDLNEKDKEKVLEAVHEIADGKTLTQLYRDLGVIREKKPAQHHPRKAVSPEDAVAAEARGREELANQVLLNLHTLFLEERNIAELKPLKKQELLAAFVKGAELCRKYLGKKGAK